MRVRAWSSGPFSIPRQQQRREVSRADRSRLNSVSVHYPELLKLGITLYRPVEDSRCIVAAICFKAGSDKQRGREKTGDSIRLTLSTLLPDQISKGDRIIFNLRSC